MISKAEKFVWTLKFHMDLPGVRDIEQIEVFCLDFDLIRLLFEEMF